MCGINGYISPKGVALHDLELMNTTLRHRGPDGQGIYLHPDKTAGLGHCRLSIIDLDGGGQPMSNEDQTLWISFNGEIYNFQELRQGLEDRHQFTTRSDTEVILHLYEEMGEQCVTQLRGMFAFAIYNCRTDTLFLARDHLGQKPLYYYHDNGEFLFSSEIKAILAVRPDLRQMDCQALYEYLTLRIITPPRSMFQGIRKLPPGHVLVFDGGTVRIDRYWTLSFEPKMKIGLPDLLPLLEKQVEQTVATHLVSDVEVGAFLSGGMDSSIIVTMMRRAMDGRFKTFSGNVPYGEYSELKDALLVSRACDTDHHELTIHPSLVRDLPHLVWHLDEPSDPLSVCMYHISRLAREKVKVVLGGDGGDELFGGYDRYYGNIYAGAYALLPEKIRKHILEKLLALMPEGFWYRSLSHKLRWIHQMSFYQGGERYARSLSYFYFSDCYKEKLYTEKFKDLSRLFDPEANLAAYFDSGSATEAIDRMLSVDAMTRLPDHPNMILDRMTMAHGLEARSPFLDHKLAEFCAAIPPHFKVKGTTRRYIQVELAKKLLPEKLLAKKKQGFSSALPYLLAEEFRLLYALFLRDASLVKDGYLNPGAIHELVDAHLAKKADHGNRLWLLLNAEIWYRMNIENQGREEICSLMQHTAHNRG